MTQPGGRGATILTYHSLDDSGSPVSTSPATFARHVALLRARGFQAITLRELLAGWAVGARTPERLVVITFDDGLGSVAERAAPVLSNAGFRATVFAVAGRSGGDNDWPGQGTRVPRQRLLSVGELGELAAEGWEIGSHGLTHADLSRLPRDRIVAEVVASRRMLEDALGREVVSFAYPYGRASSDVRGLVASTYRAACSADLGSARPGDDRFWLRRVDTYYLRRPALFRLLETPAGRAYLAVRSVGRRARIAVPSSGRRA